MENTPEPTRSAILALDVPAAESHPFVCAPPLSEMVIYPTHAQMALPELPMIPEGLLAALCPPQEQGAFLSRR